MSKRRGVDATENRRWPVRRPPEANVRLMTRLAGLAVLVMVAVGPVLAGPAADASSTVTKRLTISQSNWYWRAQPGNVCNQGAAPPQSVPDPTVPAGELVVAGPEGPTCPGGPNGPVKESYVAFDLSGIAMGSTIESFVLTLPVDAAHSVTPPSGSAPMVACAVQTSWSGGPGAQPFAGKPLDQCTAASPHLTSVRRGAAYRVDITSIAQSWLTAGGLNDGVALTDQPTNAQSPYQIDFGSASALTKAVATVTYLPAAPVPAAPSAGSASAGTQPTTVAGGGTSTQPPAGASGGAPAGPGSIGLPTTATAPPAPASAPSLAAPQVATTPASQALTRGAGSVPGGGFWVAAGGLTLLLVVTAFVLGDRRPAPRRVRVGGVSRALRQLQLTSSLESQ